MKSTKGTLALVTGGARGIGYHIAEGFLNLGVDVVLWDVNEESLDEAVQTLSDGFPERRVHGDVVDIADGRQIRKAADATRKAMGIPHYLVNNAGVGLHALLRETPLKAWKRLIDINLLGPVQVTEAFASAMEARGSGVIVNVSSGQAFFRMPTWGAYAAVKGALGIYSEVLGFEMAPRGIRVVTVYPFMVNTDFYENVEGRTTMDRLVMKLMPLYSLSPQRVAALICRAAIRGKRVELTSSLNRLAQWGQVIPGAQWASGTLAALFLATPKAPSPLENKAKH